ncbi:hypothetical protein VAE308_870004 [Vibrio aestuarianus]|uniref:Uncharacterized protein n=1 Tax=Vibrio aestuarianus TaxID=28171 RepID=A0ABN8TMJ1_9VIBR|nr:hypothetical protein VAE063_730005 [Vibrio aestuarianus]CAH8234818.1 hypothetical protein VAE308_870004 [Vibrio aestuarianus]
MRCNCETLLLVCHSITMTVAIVTKFKDPCEIRPRYSSHSGHGIFGKIFPEKKTDLYWRFSHD